ncbi:MAG TPA: hypothetical protein VMQ11_02880 [Alphaproteobacteria bacterium]|nr:hypothetical protein [Alphaproteobacteria bacterium]
MSDAHDTDFMDLDENENESDIDLELGLEISPEEERTCPERACGDPACHDRLLAALRRSHPEGHDNVAEAGGRLPRWRASRVQTSLVGCSAGLCADAA